MNKDNSLHRQMEIASRSYRRRPKWMFLCDGRHQPYYIEDYIKLLEHIAYEEKNDILVAQAKKIKHFLDTGETV